MLLSLVLQLLHSGPVVPAAEFRNAGMPVVLQG